jgi:hypothetical protein
MVTKKLNRVFWEPWKQTNKMNTKTIKKKEECKHKFTCLEINRHAMGMSLLLCCDKCGGYKFAKRLKNE